MSKQVNRKQENIQDLSQTKRETQKEKKFGISGSVLKWIAILSMLIDHIACVFIFSNFQKDSTCFLQLEQNTLDIIWDVYGIMREIGRLAFPIFCFLLVEGAAHTSNFKKYISRLFLFAFISEIPFDLAMHHQLFFWGTQNVYFTLFFGLLAIQGMAYFREKKALAWICVILAGIAAQVLHTDYGVHGIVIIMLFYLFRLEEKWKVILGSFYEAIIMGIGEAAAALAFIPMHFYNGKRGRQMKYFFYLFYPVHLFVLYLINMCFFL